MYAMNSVTEALMRLRGGKPFRCANDNCNMYRIVAEETDGSRTAYYFTAPIYRQMDCRPVDLRFTVRGGEPVFYGSDARISCRGANLLLRNTLGRLRISFADAQPFRCAAGMLQNDSMTVRPTLNGVAVTVACDAGEGCSLVLETSEIYKKIRNTETYIAFMHGRFEPFFVLSGLYAHVPGDGMQPVRLDLLKTDERHYRVTVRTYGNTSATVAFEINLYEGKFFQDTTVSSRLPDKNNCYGSTAFLGHTMQFGEQWLYTKTSRKKVFDIETVPIRSIRMHIPIFEADAENLAAYLPKTRFCSFGSTWFKKVPCGELYGNAVKNGDYFTLDLTALLTNAETKRLQRAEGIVLRTSQNERAVLATGDCCALPTILEVNYMP